MKVACLTYALLFCLFTAEISEHSSILNHFFFLYILPQKSSSFPSVAISSTLVIYPKNILYRDSFDITNSFNSLTTEKQTTTFSSANFQKMLSPSYIILRIQRLEGKQCRSR